MIQQSETAISPWQNPVNQFDVNANGTISGLDALLVINRLLLGLSGPLPAVATVPPYIDVDGNGSLSPFDALLVISYLTTHPAAAPQVQTLVTTEDVTAAESAAAGVPSTFAAPQVSAAPSTAVSQDANPVAVGLAISQMSSLDDDAADWIAQDSADIASQPAAAGVSQSRTKDPASVTAAALAATFESEALDERDSELDAILADLAEDTLQLAG